VTAKREGHFASHVFNIAVLVVGATLLAWMLDRLGWENVRRVLAGVGGWFALIVALDIAAVGCEAAAIRELMRPEARMVKYWRVLAAQVSGRAINILTPGGALGEATKVTLLVAHAPRGRVVSSIVLLNLAAFYLSVAILIVGVPLTALFVDLPPDLRLVIWIGLAVVLGVVATLVVVVQRGALGTLFATLRRVRLLSPQRAERWTARLADIDRHIRELHSNRTAGTRTGLLLVCAARLCSWTATTIVLYTVGVELGFTVLVGVFSIGVLVSWISAFVPLGLGVADASNYALYDVLGAAGAQGVFVTMIGRARSLTLALLGVAVMAAAHTSSRLVLARRNRLMARLEAEHGAESPLRSG
jgi:hypothetical protein